MRESKTVDGGKIISLQRQQLTPTVAGQRVLMVAGSLSIISIGPILMWKLLSAVL